MALRFRAKHTSIPASLIKRICDLTGLSIGEVRSRAANGEPLFEVAAFENDWDEERFRLSAVAKGIVAGSLPLDVSEGDEDEETETPISSEGLATLIMGYREIELQDQRSEDLRMGVIQNPADFEPHDDDWTVG